MTYTVGIYVDHVAYVMDICYMSAMRPILGVYIDGSAQDYSNSIANTLDILKSSAKPFIDIMSAM